MASKVGELYLELSVKDRAAEILRMVKTNASDTAKAWDFLVATQGKFVAGLSVIQERMQKMRSFGGMGGLALGGLVAAGSMAAGGGVWETLSGRIQYATAAIGQAFTPALLQVARIFQSIGDSVRAMNPVLKTLLGSLAVWTVAGIAIVKVTGLIVGTAASATTALASFASWIGIVGTTARAQTGGVGGVLGTVGRLGAAGAGIGLMSGSGGGVGGTLMSTAGGALAGAAIGSFAGPIGTAVGAAIGGIVGFFKGLFSSSGESRDLATNFRFQSQFQSVEDRWRSLMQIGGGATPHETEMKRIQMEQLAALLQIAGNSEETARRTAGLVPGMAR